MTKTCQLRWFEWVTVVLIAAALVLALMPHSHAAAAPDWLAALPVSFIGLLAPLVLVGFAAARRAARPSAEPLLPASFQRPPPSQLL